jgi:hypothetical protein
MRTARHRVRPLSVPARFPVVRVFAPACGPGGTERAGEPRRAPRGGAPRAAPLGRATYAHARMPPPCDGHAGFATGVLWRHVLHNK